ncbi:hypothetical protein FHT76_008445 [Rhizobium sp. BK176]|nr:hypothetical protein [Rhizobium sp. BK176]
MDYSHCVSIHGNDLTIHSLGLFPENRRIGVREGSGPLSSLPPTTVSPDVAEACLLVAGMNVFLRITVTTSKGCPTEPMAFELAKSTKIKPTIRSLMRIPDNLLCVGVAGMPLMDRINKYRETEEHQTS